MAVVFNWHRGTRGALAGAINALDVRLAAVEALTAPGVRVAAPAVSGSASIPSHWVQDAIRVTAVTGSASVPARAVSGSAARSASAVSVTASIPAVTVTVP